MPDQPQKPDPDSLEIDPDAPAEKPLVHTRDVIDEALAKQAAKRAVREPAIITSTIPMLPRQPKPARDRKRRRQG